jgi:hypothetical protein
MGFLDNYEGNKERTDRWLATFKKGRIEVNIVEFNAEKGYILVQAKGWRDQTELEPADVDYAYGFLAAYNPNMKRWFVEDTVTSAKMRVMANMLGGTEKATRETMEQVEKLSTKVATANVKADYDYWTTKHGDVPSFATATEAEQSGVASFGSSINEIAQQLGGELIEEKPRCEHGTRVWKTGESAKTSKAWGGYFCTERAKAAQCEPLWYQLGSTGQWVVRLP